MIAKLIRKILSWFKDPRSEEEREQDRAAP